MSTKNRHTRVRASSDAGVPSSSGTTSPEWTSPAFHRAVAGLVLLTAFIYWPVVGFEFVNFDDDVHVYNNPYVKTGLNAENLRWAFGIHGPSQWHPLAWMSHQLDCHLFGAGRDAKSAGWHHLVNLLLHLGCMVLLAQFIARLTGRTERALLVVALFGLHPLNVESVAWISERRTVLCVLCLLAALLAWLRYTARPSGMWYLAAGVCFTLALLAKPLAVTFPCLLLLLDVWPLQRWRSEHSSARPLRIAGRLIVEKLPFFGLSFVSSLLTVWCQQSEGIISSWTALPLQQRLANAVLAYGNYLRDTIWPWNLSVFYPHPALTGELETPGTQMAILFAGLTLAAITVIGWKLRRRSPWLLFGWFWFLGTMVPMIGLVQSGIQQRADRYTYLPNIGLYLAVAASLPWATGSPATRKRLVWACGALVLVLAMLTRLQLDVWSSSRTLFEQALIVNPRNSLAHLNAGQAALEANETDVAESHFQAALLIQPDYGLAHYNLGVIAYERGQFDQAFQQFQSAVQCDPRHADAWVRLGAMFAQAGRFDDAERCFTEALQIEPEHAHAGHNLNLLKSARPNPRSGERGID
jgi:protein O-mannosyl-transferase